MDVFIPSIKVIFHLTADDFNLDEVTCRIGVTPSEVRRKDEFPSQIMAHTEWSISVKEENGISVSTVFDHLLTHLECKKEIIQSICTEFELEAGFTVVIHMKDGDSPEIVLPREIISFAASIDAEIGFDLYCYE